MVNFPSPTPIFPLLPPQTYSQHKKPLWKSDPFTAISGRENQMARAVYPRWEYELNFGKEDSSWLRDQTQNIAPYGPTLGFVEWEKLGGLFLQCLGSYGEFFYEDVDDNSRLGVDCGTTLAGQTDYIIYYSWGDGPFSPSMTIPVGGVKTLDAVYLDSVLQDPSSYSLNSATRQYLTFHSDPGSGHSLTVDLHFYFRCRFLEDLSEYEMWAVNLTENRTLRFRSVKSLPPVPLAPIGAVSPLTVTGTNSTNGRIVVSGFGNPGPPVQLSFGTVGPLTTTDTNSLVVLLASYTTIDSSTYTLPNIGAISGLSWSRRFISGPKKIATTFWNVVAGIEIWYARSTAVLTGFSFDVNFTGAVQSASFGCFAVGGYDIVDPWDDSPTQISVNGSSAVGLSVQVPYVTSNPNELTFGFFAGYTNPVFSGAEPISTGFSVLSGGSASGSSVPGWIDCAILLGGSNIRGAWNQCVGLYQILPAASSGIIPWANGATASSWIAVADSIRGRTA